MTQTAVQENDANKKLPLPAIAAVGGIQTSTSKPQPETADCPLAGASKEKTDLIISPTEPSKNKALIEIASPTIDKVQGKAIESERNKDERPIRSCEIKKEIDPIVTSKIKLDSPKIKTGKTPENFDDQLTNKGKNLTKKIEEPIIDTSGKDTNTKTRVLDSKLKKGDKVGSSERSKYVSDPADIKKNEKCSPRRTAAGETEKNKPDIKSVAPKDRIKEIVQTQDCKSKSQELNAKSKEIGQNKKDSSKEKTENKAVNCSKQSSSKHHSHSFQRNNEVSTFYCVFIHSYFLLYSIHT